jgi:hypothetical protein
VDWGSVHLLLTPSHRQEYGMPGDYVAGSDIDDVRRVGDAMLALGLV